MRYKNFELDSFQEQAILAIEQNHSVVVSAPTGSGKTLIAEYIIERDLAEGIRVIYTAPIKALSNQKYKDFCAAYGAQNVGVITGDVVKNSGAPILIMTTEIYRNMVLSNDPVVSTVSYVIFDEIHYINDVDRGYVWEESIIFSKPNVRLLCLSATIPNAEEFALWIQSIKGHPVIVVRHDVRPVPLHVHFYDSELGISTLTAIKQVAEIDDYHFVTRRSNHRTPRLAPPDHAKLVCEIKEKTPCLFFCFSRSGCEQKAEQLFSKNLFAHNAEITAFIIAKLRKSPPEINSLQSTKLLRKILPFGIGFHHAGLLPVMKDLVEDLFALGLIKVLYTTETFAVGLNLPAQTVCFESLRKFDGTQFRLLTSKEYFQIAGRAGRRGKDIQGFVFIMIDRKDFDFGKIHKIISSDTEPIVSQFRLSVNTILNLIDQHTPTEIDHILSQSFHSFQEYGKNFLRKKNYRSHSAFAKYLRILEKKKYVVGGKLTEKGIFASNIYSDEILISEIFATDFWKQLSPYFMLLIVASICYEGRDRIQFKLRYSQSIRALGSLLATTPFLSKDNHFEYLDDVASLVHPCYNDSSIFDLFSSTSLPEGDIIRFLRQLVDRLNQIMHATHDRTLIDSLEFIQEKIVRCLAQIDITQT